MSHKINVGIVMDKTINIYHTEKTFKPYRIATEAYGYGYACALRDFGIWKDGSQTIGAMQNDIKVIIKELNEELDIEVQ